MQIKIGLHIITILLFFSGIQAIAQPKSRPNAKDVFDSEASNNSDAFVRPPQVMRAKSTTPEMQELIAKIEKVAKGDEVTCELLANSLRRIRDEVESVVNKLEEVEHTKSKKPGISRSFVLIDIKQNEKEPKICGFLLRDSGNVSRMVAIVEYDIEDQSIELVGYGQAQ